MGWVNKQDRKLCRMWGGAIGGVRWTLTLQPRTGKELLAAAGYSQRTGNFKRAVERLLSLRLVTYTLPDAPQSRLQKYQLTALGRQWLKT